LGNVSPLGVPGDGITGKPDEVPTGAVLSGGNYCATS